MSFLSGKAKQGLPVPLGTGTLLTGVLVLTMLVYLPAVRYQFVYDDQGQIVENALIQSWRFVPEYFQGHVWQYLYPEAPANYYRPLNMLWFRINHALFALNPAGWHAATIFLHLLATALAFAIVRRITGRPLTAAITALLFGIHPTRHEVVAWISGSTESLCAVLFFFAFLAYLFSREKHKIAWMSVSGVFCAASLLAKETAIILPGLVLAHALLYGPNRDAKHRVELSWWSRVSQAAALTSVYAPILALYLVLRTQVLQGLSHPQTGLSVATLLGTAPSVVFFYLRQWFWPVGISAFYDLSLRTQWDTVHVLLPVLALAVFAAVLWRFRRNLGSQELAWGAAAMALPLLPVLYVSVFPAGELVHDRYAYLPGLGAAMVVALALQPLCKGNLVFRLPQRLVLALLVVVPLSYGTANASSYWVDDLTLFEHAHQMAPANLLVRNHYAVALSRDGQHGRAMTMLEGLVKEHPNYYLANYNLGRLLYEMNLVNPSEHYLQRAKSIAPDREDTYLQLGLVAMKTGRPGEALSNFRRAAALRPQDARIRFALGVVLAQGGECAQARAEFSEALALNPNLLKAKEQREECGSAAQMEGAGVSANTGSSPAPHHRVVTVQDVR